MPEIDISRIAGRILQENFLMLLGFPAPDPLFRGYVPLRVVAREFYYYPYDAYNEGQIGTEVPAGLGVTGITDLGFTAPTRLGSTNLTGKPSNVFALEDYSHVYQLFMGMRPDKDVSRNARVDRTEKPRHRPVGD